jgi:hypothetical protein
MLIRLNQRGEGKLGCVIGLLILVAAVFVAYKMIPVKVRATEFRDAVFDSARSAGQNSQDGIRATLVHKADQLRLPIKADQIKIDRRSDYVTIEVEYTVPVEFPGFVYQWKFAHKAENPVF